MKNFAALLLGVVVAAPVFAQVSLFQRDPEIGRVYLGLGSGVTDFNNSKFSSVSWSRFESRDTPYKILGGYQFNRFYAVEIAYSQLGKTNSAGIFTANDGEAFNYTSSRHKGSAVAASFRYSPLPGGAISPFVKLGVSRVTNEYDLSGFRLSGAFSQSSKQTETRPYFAIGALIPMSEDLSLSLEVEDFGRVGSNAINAAPALIHPRTVSASIIRRF